MIYSNVDRTTYVRTSSKYSGGRRGAVGMRAFAQRQHLSAVAGK